MILLIDNYDSFTYNLYQLLSELGESVTVIRNDKITVEDIEQMNPTAIVLSPGPGRPENAGICVEIIKKLHSKFPIFGVCLGHQAIAYSFGGKIISASKIMHGKESLVDHDSNGIFEGIESPMKVGRYHSLAVERKSLPEVFEETSSVNCGEIMSIKHKEYPVYGLQFHPESILTPNGKQLLVNFLDIVRG